MTPNHTHIETRSIQLLEALKEIFRDRRISYQAIADALDVSLPTVKRMLNKPGLPLDRLFALCQIADIEPAEVFALADKNKPTHTNITAEQDQLFFDHPEFLSYFMELFDSGKSPQQIADENELSKLSTERYLSGLAKVGLIERGLGLQYQLMIDPPIGFGPDSKVLQASFVDFLDHTVKQVLSTDTEKGCFSILKPLRLPNDLYLEMIDELSSIVDKYAYLSEHSNSRKITDREDWNLAIASGPGLLEKRAPIINL